MKKLLLLIWFMLTGLPIQAATYYASPAGSDAVTCPQATNIFTPKRTVNGGLSCMSGGDVLILRAGTYAEHINTLSGSNVPSGSPGSPTTIQNSIGETVTIQPPGGCGTCEAIVGNLLDSRSWVTFDGLNYDNVNITPGNPTTNPSSDIWKFSGNNSHITITNSTGIRSQMKNGAIGIYLGPGECDQCTFSNLEIFNMVNNTTPNITGQSGYGIYICPSNSTIENIYSHDNFLYGILQYVRDFADGILSCIGNTYRNNIINNTGVGMYFCCLTNSLSGATGTITIYNNLITNTNSGGQGISLNGTGSGSSTGNVTDNTIYGGTGSGVEIFNGPWTVQNTILLGNSGGSILNTSGTGSFSKNLCPSTSAACAFSSTPLVEFGNASPTNFHLVAGAVSRNNANNLSSTCCTTDLDGVMRPASPTPWDIGVYQFVTTSSVPVLAMNSFRRSR